MTELEQYIQRITAAGVTKIIISNPGLKSAEFRKIVIEIKGESFQVSKYTQKQVFHENGRTGELAEATLRLAEGYRQINGISPEEEHIILVSRKGNCSYKVKKSASGLIRAAAPAQDHNRRKNYILSEGMQIPPLVDMGIFTAEGKVVSSMYDKYKQINRFIEILDDEIREAGLKKVNVIDFGCGKSYLTFVVYYYLKEVLGLDTRIMGLDLKEDVIRKCNAAAAKYGYDGLSFEVGNIDGYEAPFDVDMVITLHACDTATDFALYNAVQWKARMIFSVSCCQHELNQQLQTEHFTLMSRYGIIKERFAALATDAIRGNLLEYCGYRTQLLEFVDLSHTPKNILIRAVKRPMTPGKLKEKALGEVKAVMEEFSFTPTLYRLLDPDARG